jgi:hypothetical protein
VTIVAIISVMAVSIVIPRVISTADVVVGRTGIIIIRGWIIISVVTRGVISAAVRPSKPHSHTDMDSGHSLA